MGELFTHASTRLSPTEKEPSQEAEASASTLPTRIPSSKVERREKGILHPLQLFEFKQRQSMECAQLLLFSAPNVLCRKRQLFSWDMIPTIATMWHAHATQLDPRRYNPHRCYHKSYSSFQINTKSVEQFSTSHDRDTADKAGNSGSRASQHPGKRSSSCGSATHRQCRSQSPSRSSSSSTRWQYRQHRNDWPVATYCRNI